LSVKPELLVNYSAWWKKLTGRGKESRKLEPVNQEEFIMNSYLSTDNAINPTQENAL